MAEFDGTTAVPVVERPDGLYQEDIFDPATANPISDTYLMESRKPLVFRPPLTEDQRSEAFMAAHIYGGKVPLGRKIDWAITSPQAQKATELTVFTLLTGGSNLVINGVKGLLESGTDISAGERLKKGIFHAEHVKDLYEKIPGSENLPGWARTTASVSETILLYVLAGVGKGKIRKNLFAKQKAAEIDKMTEQMADDFMKQQGVKVVEGEAAGTATSKQGVTLAEYDVMRDQAKEALARHYMSKMSAVDTRTLTTGFESEFEKTSLLNMIGKELSSKGVSVGAAIKPAVGQQVAVTTGGKQIVGIIKEVLGSRVKLKVGNTIFVATVDQLTNVGVEAAEAIPESSEAEALKDVADYVSNIEKQVTITDPDGNVVAQVNPGFPKELTGYKTKEIDAVIKRIVEGKPLASANQEALKGEMLKVHNQMTGENLKLPTPKPKLVKMQPETFVKNKLVDIQRGYREGKIDMKAEVGSVQKQFIETLKNSQLDTADKGTFLSAMKEIKTNEQFVKAMPKIQERIANIAEQKAVKKAVGQFEKITKNKDIKKLRPEYKSKVQEIAEQFSPSTPTDAKVTGLNSLANYLASEPNNLVPQSKIDELRRLNKQPLRTLTSDEINGVVAAIQHLIKLNDLKNTIIVKGKIKDHVEVVNEAVINIKENNELREGSFKELGSEIKNPEETTVQKVSAGYSYNTELRCQICDGKDGGIIMQVVYDGINTGTDNQLKFVQRAEEFFADKLKGIKIDNWSHSFNLKAGDVPKFKYKLENYDKPINLTKGERVAFYLHTLNPNNVKHLIGGGFSFQNKRTVMIPLTMADIDKIAGSLTDEEYKVAEAINEYLNTIQKDAINGVSVRLDGFETATEDNYWGIKTNDLDRKLDILIKAGKGFSNEFLLEGMGIFKQRQGASNAIILEDAFSALAANIKKVGAYVGLAEPLRSAKALVADGAFKSALIDHGKEYYIDLFDKYITAVEGEYLKLDDIDRLTQAMINKLDMSILGLNPFVMSMQPVSYMAADIYVDGKILIKNFKPTVTATEREELRKYAPQLYERLQGHISRELGEVMNIGFAKKFFTGKRSEGQWMMDGIVAGDTASIGSIWRSVKEEISVKYPDLKGQEFYDKVYDRAWFIIRRTQPTFHVKDRSPIGMSKNIALRIVTKYSSQRNKNWNMFWRGIEEYNQSDKTPKDKARLAKIVAIVAVMMPLAIGQIRKFRSWVMGKDKEKSVLNRKETQGLLEETVVDLIGTNLGNIYVLGTGYNSLVSKIQNGTFGGYGTTNIIGSAADTAINTAVHGWNSIAYAITNERYKPESGKILGEKKWKKSVIKMSEGLIDITGKVKGVNAELMRKFIKAQHERTSGEKKKKRKEEIKKGFNF